MAKDKNRLKMNSHEVTVELRKVLLRYRAGLISLEQARQEKALLQASLKAIAQAKSEPKDPEEKRATFFEVIDRHIFGPPSD